MCLVSDQAASRVVGRLRLHSRIEFSPSEMSEGNARPPGGHCPALRLNPGRKKRFGVGSIEKCRASRNFTQFDPFDIARPEASGHAALWASEIDCQTLLLPIAIAHRFGPLASAKFGRQREGGCGGAASLGLGKGALGFGGQRGFLGFHVLFI